ncbi:MAG: NAD-dependent epimerase/dehydratase family protein [Proteobacteria bacterium]|nr:NAD-dependent epimerase/dehydratase family protein [Pseudomonadota bacterium]
MRVLVTGHLGYIGTVLYPRMLQEGFEVVGLDSDLYRGSTFGSAPQEVETISKDLRDVEQKLRDLQNMQHTLNSMVSKCDGGSVPECPIIDALFEMQ